VGPVSATFAAFSPAGRENVSRVSVQIAPLMPPGIAARFGGRRMDYTGRAGPDLAAHRCGHEFAARCRLWMDMAIAGAGRCARPSPIGVFPPNLQGVARLTNTLRAQFETMTPRAFSTQVSWYRSHDCWVSFLSSLSAGIGVSGLVRANQPSQLAQAGAAGLSMCRGWGGDTLWRGASTGAKPAFVDRGIALPSGWAGSPFWAFARRCCAMPIRSHHAAVVQNVTGDRGHDTAWFRPVGPVHSPLNHNSCF